MYNSHKGVNTYPRLLLKRAVAVVLMGVCLSAQALSPPMKPDLAKFAGLGRVATPAEVAAWDIDVRPDFKGLPAGSGTVAKGQDIWEAKCASCHGVFGESNEVFSPLIGGTTAADITTGRVARLLDPSFPGRTTLMKVPTVSTLFDYINRAMPWTQPKSLKPDEVYSVLAFMLNLGGIVPEDFALSDKNIAQVQAKMPNRNGMTTRHAMWPTTELGGVLTPDIKAVACMTNCVPEVKVSSFLPDFARNAHGNLAEQNRPVGAQKGADTSKPEVQGKPMSTTVAPTTPVAKAAKEDAPPAPAANVNKAAIALLAKNACTGCHGMTQKLVGPSFAEIAKRHSGKVDYLAGKIKSGGSGVWGNIPMPAQALSVADATTIATWLAAGAQK
jgi:S-disulfanyl-L-cysteine oxidoreductase SoxD